MVRSAISICRSFACVLLLFIAIDAQAGTISLRPQDLPTISIADESGNAWNYTPTLGQLKSSEGRGWALSAAPEHAAERGQFLINQLEFDPDPFVLNNILITNTTAATQIFTVGIALPTVFAAPNEISGTVRTDVIDGGGSAGATVASVSGFPIYAAQIDFGTVATLQNDPFSLTAPASGTATSSASFGPTASLVPVTSNIGIQLRFSLSAGDTASILSRFDVTAPTIVPLPAAAWGGLALFSLLPVMRYRRR